MIQDAYCCLNLSDYTLKIYLLTSLMFNSLAGCVFKQFEYRVEATRLSSQKLTIPLSCTWSRMRWHKRGDIKETVGTHVHSL